jgi:hypothetical protein
VSQCINCFHCFLATTRISTRPLCRKITRRGEVGRRLRVEIYANIPLHSLAFSPCAQSNASTCELLHKKVAFEKTLFSILLIPCIFSNGFTTLNQKNTQTCSLNIYTVTSHVTFLHARISVHKGPSSENQSNKAYSHISHFCAQLTWCERVKWLKYRHFRVEQMYKYAVS